MFEYLMPLLVMPTYDGTLLDQTCRAAVERQIDYGRQRGVPWGISESGYNTVDAHLNYQYRAFGVPGLGLKRGLADDLVVAPYATALALMVAPEAACANLQRLAAAGFEGRSDSTKPSTTRPRACRAARRSAIVRSFMAHHQGMSLLSLAYLLLDRPMQRRFVSDPRSRRRAAAAGAHPEPRAFHPHSPSTSTGSAFAERARDARCAYSARRDTPTPEVQLLSNGRYHVMVTNAGGGYSRWRDLAVTRWREDSTRDNWGTSATCATWTAASSGRPRTSRRCGGRESYEAMFSEGRAEFRRRDHDFETLHRDRRSPEDDIELRRLRITNHARDARGRSKSRATPKSCWRRRPRTRCIPPSATCSCRPRSSAPPQAILCTRRPRSAREPRPGCST